MNVFTDKNIIEFRLHFQNDENCSRYLGKLKWSKDYGCRKCGYSKFQIRNKCNDTKCPCVNTLFHRVRFGLLKDFYSCFEMSNSTKSISANQMAERVRITEKTARLFMYKVREAMKSSEKFPIDDLVHVEEFCYRIKHSQNKDTWFNNLLIRIVKVHI